MPPNTNSYPYSSASIKNRNKAFNHQISNSEFLSMNNNASYYKHKKGKTKRKKNIMEDLSYFIAFVFICIYILANISKKDPPTIQMQCNASSKNEEEEFAYLAKVDQHLKNVYLHKVDCFKPGYKDERVFNAEPENCGTLVYDELVPMEDTLELRKMASKLIYELGETNYYSRESVNLYYVNLHVVFKNGYRQGIFNDSDFKIIKRASEAAKKTIATTFGIPLSGLHFTTVAQFTRYRPMTNYSQFRHVDKVRSKSLVVTSILWLSTYGAEFGGGRTAFLTGGPKPYTPLLVEPKRGRFAAWTSGWENPHEVMQMLYGERYAIIFAFTANPSLGEVDMDALKHWAQSIEQEAPFSY